jgi:hypothetical protein
MVVDFVLRQASLEGLPSPTILFAQAARDGYAFQPVSLDSTAKCE